MAETCETCRFWRVGEPTWLGRCRRFPPPHVNSRTNPRPDFFPMTSHQTWCGEFAFPLAEIERLKENDRG